MLFTASKHNSILNLSRQQGTGSIIINSLALTGWPGLQVDSGEGSSDRGQPQVHMRMKPITLHALYREKSDSLNKLDGHLENIMEARKAINLLRIAPHSSIYTPELLDSIFCLKLT